MERKHRNRKSERTEPSPQPIEPELERPLEEDEEHARTPASEPPRDKRSDDL